MRIKSLSVLLLLTLFVNSGITLKCYKCDACKPHDDLGWEISCPDGQICATYNLTATYIEEVLTQLKKTCQLPSTTCDDVRKERQPYLDAFAATFPIGPGGESFKSYIECKTCDTDLCNI